MLRSGFGFPRHTHTPRGTNHTHQGTGTDDCKQCTPPTDDYELPEDEDRFQNGRLDCTGSTSCQSSSNTLSWFFKNANDYLNCQGSNSCKGSWLVQNLGGACCVGDQSCNNRFFFDFSTQTVPDGQPAAACTNDVCCNGISACYGTSGSSESTQLTRPAACHAVVIKHVCRSPQTSRKISTAMVTPPHRTPKEIQDSQDPLPVAVPQINSTLMQAAPGNPIV